MTKDARFCCRVVIPFWPGIPKKPGLNLEGQEGRAFFGQGCQESPVSKQRRPRKPSFGGQGCQESLAVAMLAGLYQAAFSR